MKRHLWSALLVAVPLLLTTAPAFAGQQRTRRPVSPWDVEARLYLGTPQSERAVERGLKYLAAQQMPDGHWASGGYPEDVAITGLCLLAFLSAGYQPGRGPYGTNLDLAVDWLAKQVQMSGQFAPPGLIRSANGGPPMYGHGFALLALAEVYGMTRLRGLKPKLEAAIRLLEDTQNQNGQPWLDGGWRYMPRPGDADLSVTIVEFMALKACQNAGLAVSQETLNRAIGYIRRAANPDGGFSYQIGQNQSNVARTGAGVLALYLSHLSNTPECQNGLRYLAEHPLDARNFWLYREHFHYAIYYVTQAAYQEGGTLWRTWYPAIRDELVRTQNANGSWEDTPFGSDAGGVYATAMSILVLQVPAGLLPIYQK
ncbi:MAG TPA: prenyltransferase/squalene oxidase repeat-containing protein [Chthonomonas sp.]|jgi:hypothetical protein|uniref:prenyltransferase/squalene oxidase repeat-containing protein n=1 Tax=Chthonomonas sp. TaxID=2282153 RepID=UPI002B4B8448|nr:prenyltransferase/squalene oxidase repeat-containing protein [Chthonomonas sp.]HLH80897.1 prenyltransferase/squalene oxidase repeat-containing protein [Chthonomonas sp.]